MKRYFYLLSALPELKTFGDPPPLKKQKLLFMVEESGGPSEIVQLILLNDDLLQREALLAGEIEPDNTDLAVLSLKQAKMEAPLPEFLLSGTEMENNADENLNAGDPVWRNFFYHALKIAQIKKSYFLEFWVKFEVGLRNALAGARAKALKLEPEPYLVAPELEDPDIMVENIVADWSRTSNPLEGAKILDMERWNRFTEYEPWYSFSMDEIAAYTAKLIILYRWRHFRGSDHK
jgi:hypothetical protein